MVRDLTAADFEVLQNRRRQKIAFAAFAEFVPVMTVAVSRASLTVPGTSAPPVAGNALGGPPPRPPTGQAQRTFVIVVDDLGLSAEGMNNVRRGLREFVETGLLPTDLAAIVRTGEVRGLLQALTGDRAALGAAVDALRYNVMSRKGVSTSDDVIQAGDATPAFNGVGPLQRSVSTAGSLAALNLVVRAARDSPGRKTVIVASEGFQLWEETRATKTPEEDPRVRYAVDRVVDQATRSGVVIYAVDGRALQPTGLRASDDVHSVDPRRNPDAAGAVLRGLAAEVALPRISQSDSTSDEMVAPRSAQGSQLQPRRCARVVRLIGDFRRAFVGRKRLLAGRRRDIRSLTCIPNRAGKKPFEGLDFAEGAVSSHRTGACQQVLGDNFTELRGGADGEIC